MNTNQRPDGWAEFAELLGLIRTLFGDALKASEALAPKIAQSASRWLRAAEAFARVLVLTLARTVELSPARTAGALAGQAVQATNAGEAPAVRRGGGRSLFAFSRSHSAHVHRPRREMTQHEIEMWYYFGGKEHAAAERERRKAEQRFVAPASCRQQREPSEGCADAGWKPALRGELCLPSQANLVRRFNALVRVFEAPDKAAQRLARRLAAAPSLTQHILAAATPREPWRSGYDDTIRTLARAAAVSHDTS